MAIITALIHCHLIGNPILSFFSAEFHAQSPLKWKKQSSFFAISSHWMHIHSLRNCVKSKWHRLNQNHVSRIFNICMIKSPGGIPTGERTHRQESKTGYFKIRAFLLQITIFLDERMVERRKEKNSAAQDELRMWACSERERIMTRGNVKRPRWLWIELKNLVFFLSSFNSSLLKQYLFFG